MDDRLSHHNPHWIDTDRAVLDLLNVLGGQSLVAVDTESDSLYSYYEKVCLLQFSIPGVDYLVDPLAANIKPLGDLFASGNVQKIFHAAEYDILSLKRDYGFEFANLFDTMVAARVVGWPQYGLGHLLNERFGVQPDKRFQRYNWGLRPLSQEALIYARLDTHYLHALREILLAELTAQNRVREASEAFQRLTQLEPSPRSFDPDGFWRIKGARRISPTAQAVLQALYIFRDKQARRSDRPPFKILTDSTLMHLARAQPQSPNELARVKGVSATHIRRFGQALLKVIREGQEASPPDYPRSRAPRPHNSTLRRYEALRRWRNQIASRRGVEPDVILLNNTLKAIAEEVPVSLKELDALELLGEWQLETYGQAILQVLRKTST
ncbi:MAG: ribonuclease D [Anaerolineae bacterium]